MRVFDELYAFSWNNPSVNNCNTYLIRAQKNLLVDPGHYHLFAHIREELSSLSLTPRDMDLIIVTHAHPDHMEGIKNFLDTPAMVGIHAVEMDFITDVAPHYLDAIGIPDFQPDFLLREGDLTVGDVSLQVIHTPGHSPGAICLYWPERKALFTGDLIFFGGIGRTDLPGGSGEALKESIKRVSTLDVEYLLPGHGEIISGRDLVVSNFEGIERHWFGFL